MTWILDLKCKLFAQFNNAEWLKSKLHPGFVWDFFFPPSFALSAQVTPVLLSVHSGHSGSAAAFQKKKTMQIIITAFSYRNTCSIFVSAYTPEGL